MNPLRIRAENLRTYPSLDLEIPDGITAITGPNGAGKSTLLAAVELALFADGGRDLTPALGPFQESGRIELEFEHGSDRYRVRRGFGKKTTLDLEQADQEWDPGDIQQWVPLTRESAKETQALLERILGLNRETFNASAYLAQGNSAAFPEASPADRKSLLGAILDPSGLWPALSEKAGADRRLAETALQVAETKQADREPLAASVPERWRDVDRAKIEAENAATRADEAQAAWDAAKAALAGNEAAAERWRGAEQAYVSALNAEAQAKFTLDEAWKAGENIASLHATIFVLDQQAARIPELERLTEEQRTAALRASAARSEKQQAEEARRRQGAIADSAMLDHEVALEKLRAANERLNHLRDAEPGAERCDRCEQILGKEARQAALASLEREAVALSAALREKQAASEEADRILGALTAAAAAITVPEQAAAETDYAEALAKARQAAQERAGLAARLEALEAIAAELPVRTQAYTQAQEALEAAQVAAAEAKAAMRDPAALEQRAERARIDAANRRVDHQEGAATLVRAEAALAQAQEAADEHNALVIEAGFIRGRLAGLRLAEKAYGRDGVPALIAENSAGQIEAEANHVLERLPTASGTTLRVELRTQRELKSGAAKETLDILVADRTTRREFLTFSGGERFRVSFALRWALALLLAQRRGAESRLLVVDEPDGLDAGGMDGLAAVLRERADVFSKVLLVSHSPLLAEAFEQVLRVESDGEVSRLAGVGVGV